MSKASELPINTLVVVIIAVIILLALVAMYLTGYGPFSKTVGIEGARGGACRQLVQENGCRVASSVINTTGFDANKDDTLVVGTSWDWSDTVMPNKCGPGATSNDNLAALCKCYYSLSTENDCKNLCGCAGGGGAGGGGGGGPGPGCTCNWNQEAPPLFCTVVGIGNGCMEDCDCVPALCGGQCTGGANVWCGGVTAPIWPEGRSGCCVVGAVGC